MAFQRKLLASIGLCAALGMAPAWAQGENETVAPPAPTSYGGVDVINGGANFEEADAIKRIQSRYNLRVEISGRGGQYHVADRIRLMQRDNLVAEVPDAGPWLLMNVPAGRYTLVGDFGGTEIKRDVVVSNHGTKVSWVLPASMN